MVQFQGTILARPCNHTRSTKKKVHCRLPSLLTGNLFAYGTGECTLDCGILPAFKLGPA